MGKLTWHKHYHVNFLEGTAELTLQERGAYITILDLIYARDGNVPDDDGFVSKVLGCHWRTWRAIKAKLITLGKIVIEFGKLVNARAKAELKKADERLDEVRPKSSEPVQERFKTPHGMSQPQQNQTLPAEEEEEDKDIPPVAPPTRGGATSWADDSIEKIRNLREGPTHGTRRRGPRRTIMDSVREALEYRWRKEAEAEARGENRGFDPRWIPEPSASSA